MSTVRPNNSEDPKTLTSRQKSDQPNRRKFIGQSAAVAGAVTLGFPSIVSARNLNEKLNIAVIGCGGRGGSNLGSVSTDNIVALVDVNDNNLRAAGERFPKARKEHDFRKLFDHEKEFDAVVVSTCEHTHAFATLPALQLGKHVYCEKPLTYNVHEARVIREQAARSKVATQMGTQIHAGDNYRRVVELVQSGAIGNVTEAHVWVSRAWGWHESEEEARRNRDIVVSLDRPKEAQTIPAGLNWDLWLGPAPERPFHSIYFPGPKWYRWWDFGNGTMSDLGSHWIDLSFWALNLDAPKTIAASGPEPHPEIAPASMQVEYEYDARGEMPPVKVAWYQGANKPKLWQEKAIPQWGNGTLFVGDKGMLLADYGKHVLLPEDNFVDFKRPEPTIPKSIGHHQEWIHACKTGDPTTCNFEYAGWLTEANHLGNVAFRTGKKIEWDAQNMQVTNAPEAERFIRRDYRKGWSLS
jgi:predicted dehydrogenase